MHHLAIMNPGWKLIPRILAGEKTIESRWYLTRRAPWDKAASGDVVWFKDAGKDVTARATVETVLQFELEGIRDAREIVKTYGDEIRLVNPDPETWDRVPRYAILLRLRDAEPVEPFAIDKTGYGNACAWIVVPDIADIVR